MLEDNQTSRNDHTELNPYVNSLAAKIMKIACEAELKFDSVGWQLISEVLSYAASAEQRLSEQQDRIEQLTQVSVTDELTGILNRRGLRRALAQILSDSARHRETGVFGFLDLNDFKKINDSYGHDAGDSVLRHFANALKKKIRPSDIIARISGDEFAVILPRCGLEEGQERLMRLQKNLNSQKFRVAGSSIALTCALGVAVIEPGIDPAILITGADVEMYKNKAAMKEPR